MKAKEELAVRLQLAEMHEEFIDRMCTAYDSKFYVETVWYCYSIIEQRVNRLISKYIDRCPRTPRCTDDRTAAISIRIKCLRKLISSKYGAFDTFDISILDRINNWCESRNELVHGLVSIKHYKKYDTEFKKLAEAGVPLVFELYDACTVFRNHWYESTDPIAPFPVSKCQCRTQQCLNPNSI